MYIKLLLSFFIVLVSCSLSADLSHLTYDEIQWLKEHPEIRFGSDPFYIPNAFTEDNVHKGINADIVSIVEKRLGVKFIHHVSNDWHDVLNDLRNRECDFVGAIHHAKHREEYLLFTKSYMSVPQVIITQSSNRRNLSMEDLAGKKVAITLSYIVENYVRENYPEIQVVTVPSDEVLLQQVALGTVDAGISDLIIASYVITEKKLMKLRIAGDVGFTMDLGFACRNDWPVFHSILIKTLNTIPQKEIDVIIDRWIQLEYKKYLYSSRFWNQVLWIVGIVIIVIVFVHLWNYTLFKAVRFRTRELNSYKKHLEDLVAARTRELSSRNEELESALDHVKTLEGMLPICARCKKVRDDNGIWKRIEEYVGDRTDAVFSHSLCPNCVAQLYGKEIADTIDLDNNREEDK